MTRINLVPPSELTDQHLFAEFREIKMVPRSLNRSLSAQQVKHSEPAKARQAVLQRIPEQYVLGKGHVSFFYDKGAYLQTRYELLKTELLKRGYKIDASAPLDPLELTCTAPWNNDYEPDSASLALVRQRIAERIAVQPKWYRFYGIPLA